MILISIDGACRRNGKPDCVSAGGVFIQWLDAEGHTIDALTLSAAEPRSTNQRGELQALREALRWIMTRVDTNSIEGDIQIVTDSEYLFNALTKQWFVGWANKNWVTSMGEAVKNKDLWSTIAYYYERVSAAGFIDINYYHIKGHCIPFGKVTAEKLLTQDRSGMALCKEVGNKFDQCINTKADNFKAAQCLSARNNGFELPSAIFKRFVVSNVMADAVATRAVDEADKLLK